MRIDLKVTLVVVLSITTTISYGQRSREIRGSVNTRSLNDIFPSVSGDGNTLVLMNDYSDDGSYVTLVSRKDVGRWGEPDELEVLNPSRLN